MCWRRNDVEEESYNESKGRSWDNGKSFAINPTACKSK
jgi:hypothetical protein